VVATDHGGAEIVGARIGIIAIDLAHADADATTAGIARCTWVTVITWVAVLGMSAPHQRQTTVGRTRVAIIAIHGLATNALTVAAGIVEGADTAVIAWGRVGLVDAALLRVAKVIGADLAVIAIQEPGRLARTFDAAFAGGAGVIVVATAGFGCMHTAQIGVARVGGARVAIVTATHMGSTARSVNAEIGNGARVAIVARGRVERKLAARFTIADIVSAGIAVVTDNHGPDTLATAAVVGHSARIAVVAGALVEGRVDAAVDPGAAICRAAIAIITSAFIDLAIAVVVQSVTGILFRNGRIAVAQAGLRAAPLAIAGTRLVGHMAQRGKAQVHGLVAALANTRLGNTLQGDLAGDGRCFQAGEPLRTVPVFLAVCTAKPPLPQVLDARGLEALGAGATTVVLAGATQVRERRDTGKGHIGTGACDLLTLESFRTLFNAEIRTDGIAHMVEAEPRLTVFGSLARFAKAPRTRLTAHPTVGHRQVHESKVWPASLVWGAPVNHRNIGHQIVLLAGAVRSVLRNNLPAAGTAQQQNHAPRPHRLLQSHGQLSFRWPGQYTAIWTQRIVLQGAFLSGRNAVYWCGHTMEGRVMKWFYRILLALLTLFCPIMLAACYGAPYEPNPDDIKRSNPDVTTPKEEVQIKVDTSNEAPADVAPTA
jgi:hypothetical protein